MAVRANVNRRFYWRFALIGVVSLIFMGACIKDGFYTYPSQMKAYHSWETLRDSGKSESEWKNEWEALAKTEGWQTDSITGKPVKERTDADLIQQYFMAIVSGLLGIGFLVPVFMSKGRWMELDGDTITTSWGANT